MFVFAGKTTLLNVLAGRANIGTVGGSILMNGSPFLGMKIANSMALAEDPSFAYVMQDDAHCPLFTVQETLEFAAMLRQRTSCREAVHEVVMETLHVMGLAHIAHHYVGVIGDSMISRGQLRRLTVGVEIVNSPSMVFLDEPTTGEMHRYTFCLHACACVIALSCLFLLWRWIVGLDSFLAATVVHGLQTLARSGRTLLCTIHSPSPSLFSMFDKLLLLSEVTTSHTPHTKQTHT
jgi:ABC-type multidrug transport system ATPase subunit